MRRTEAADDIDAASGAPRDWILQEYISESELVAGLDMKPRTIQRMRQRGDAPPYIVIARKIYYSREGTREWLKSRQRGGPRNQYRRRRSAVRKSRRG